MADESYPAKLRRALVSLMTGCRMPAHPDSRYTRFLTSLHGFDVMIARITTARLQVSRPPSRAFPHGCRAALGLCRMSRGEAPTPARDVKSDSPPLNWRR